MLPMGMDSLNEHSLPEEQQVLVTALPRWEFLQARIAQTHEEFPFAQTPLP